MEFLPIATLSAAPLAMALTLGWAYKYVQKRNESYQEPKPTAE